MPISLIFPYFESSLEWDKLYGTVRPDVNMEKEFERIWKLRIVMFNELKEINLRPEPFQFYTSNALWTDEHTSQKMLEYHLDESVDLSSRNKDFIDRSVKWIVSHFGIDRHTAIADFGCGVQLASVFQSGDPQARI